MKGVIFRGFIEFVEQQLGAAYLETVLAKAELASNGAYTNIGTYDHNELLTMVALIASDHDLPINELVESFGYFTFSHLQKTYPSLVATYANSFQCIYHVDQTIHKNVRKIHPDAQLPNLKAELSADRNCMTLYYQSERPFVYFTLGLIKGCVAYFKDAIEISFKANSQSQAVFTLRRDR